MNKSFLILLVILFLTLKHLSFAQCFSSPETWLAELSSLEESSAQAEEQLTRCLQLKSNYFKCTSRKDSIYAKIVHRLGDYYHKNGNYPLAIEFTKEAIRINSSKKPSVQRAYLCHSYYNLGLFYNYLYHFPESHQCFDSCISIAKTYPEKTYIALMAFEQKAFSFYRMGDYEKTIEISETGISTSVSSGNRVFSGILLAQLAQAQNALGKNEEAEINIRESIRLLIDSDLPLEYLASAYSIYADVVKKKAPASAVDYYKKAYAINFKSKNFAQSGRDLSDLGLLLDKELNDAKQAIKVYKKGIEIVKKIKDGYQLAGLFNNLGLVYWKQKDFHKALYYYQKGLTSLPIGFKDTTLQSNPSFAMLKLVQNDYFVSQLLSDKGESLLELYKSEKKPVYLQYALNTFLAADKAVDQMRMKQFKEESKLFWRDKTKKMYENAIHICYLLNDAEHGFFFFEKSRAVLLNDKLMELNAKKLLSKETQAKEKQLRSKISYLQDQLNQVQQTYPNYTNIKQELFETQGDFEQFIKNLEKNNPTYYEYKYKTTVPTVKQVRKKILKDQYTLIEYFTTDHYVFALMISGKKAKIFRLNIQDFPAMATALNNFCANRSLLNSSFPQFAQLAYHLNQKLFQPLKIPTKKVIVSPDEQFIPFEVLLTNPQNSSSFLIKKHIFSYAYSASILFHKETAPSGSLNILGVAPVSFKDYLKKSTLRGSELSLEKIKTYFSCTFLTHQEATKKAFLKQLPSFEIVQLYTHAEADSSEKEPLLFFYDSAMHVNELQNLSDVKTRLILLSACKTGVGKTMRGEGVFSLSRSFAASGIPATITTLWEIDNQSTYRITELFYKFLYEGMASDEAMQKAKLEYLKVSDKEQQLPYFWGASILIGRTNISKNTQSVHLVYYVVFGIIILFFILISTHFQKKSWKVKHSNAKTIKDQ